MTEMINNFEGKPGLALDIDETLSWTLGYVVEDMQKLFGNPENLSARELIKKYRFVQEVPYWQTKEVYDWTERQWESSILQEVLPLIKGAKEYVKKIAQIIPIKVYLTVRPSGAIPGTRIWLKKHDFPKAEIISRPEDIAKKDASKWKAEKLVELYPSVLGIVDDNPEILDFLPKDYQGKIFLYGFKKDELKVRKNVYLCKEWKDVFEKIKNLSPAY